MFFAKGSEVLQAVHQAVSADYLADEAVCVDRMLAELQLSEHMQSHIDLCATDLVRSVRQAQRKHAGVAAFMHEYELSSPEGVVLMCLAEALLRIPDAATADKLIRDKITSADWQRHLGKSHSLFVNASTWGLVLTGTIVRGGFDGEALFKRLVARLGESIVRKAIQQSMRLLGHQFVMGDSIENALQRSVQGEYAQYRYSFDMLGEAALTEADAERYARAYRDAIEALAQHATGDPHARPSISIKLSALHPRYDFFSHERVLAELTPRLLTLAKLARDSGVWITLDAEEADRLEISLAVYQQVSAQLGAWDGFGLVVQAYQKRAPAVLRWLAELARQQGRRIPVRLVKGAYWDTEIKRAQERGLRDYPVYTRKENTDVAYRYCAQFLANNLDLFFPQFATHNAQTVAAIMELMPSSAGFEFQRLHGMGDALYEQVLARPGYACRVYAPVGSYQDLLPYLVRRLLENGANTSFVNRVEDEQVPVEQIIADPLQKAQTHASKRHPRIALPRDIYRSDQRENSAGVALHNQAELNELGAAMKDFPGKKGYRPDSGLRRNLSKSQSCNR
ncbi:MAG: proline dehydrogenase family protein [Gammaproteobacteria bacterium]|nr:proline dehydrogenase family protein [Gammaproteobacteria bacterium]